MFFTLASKSIGKNILAKAIHSEEKSQTLFHGSFPCDLGSTEGEAESERVHFSNCVCT